MRIVVSVLVLVLLPTVGFFLWAWLVAMARERRLSGTLPRWQDLPWTWLIISGLALALAGILYLVLLTDRPAGGWFGPPQDAATDLRGPPQSAATGEVCAGHTPTYARIAPSNRGRWNFGLVVSAVAWASPGQPRRRHADNLTPVAGEEV